MLYTKAMQPENGNTPEDKQNYWNSSENEDFSDQQPQPEQPGQNIPGSSNAPVEPEQPQPLIEWQASEFIHHPKSALWYVVYGIISVAGVAAAVFLMKDWFAAFCFAVAFFTFGFFAARKPRTLRYMLDEAGLHVGEGFYAYTSYHAFGVLQEEGIYSIVLLPNARFSPVLTIYFTRELGEQIVDILSQYLPMQEVKLEWIDKISRKIRF